MFKGAFGRSKITCEYSVSNLLLSVSFALNLFEIRRNFGLNTSCVFLGNSSHEVCSSAYVSVYPSIYPSTHWWIVVAVISLYTLYSSKPHSFFEWFCLPAVHWMFASWGVDTSAIQAYSIKSVISSGLVGRAYLPIFSSKIRLMYLTSKSLCPRFSVDTAGLLSFLSLLYFNIFLRHELARREVLDEITHLHLHLHIPSCSVSLIWISKGTFPISPLTHPSP